MRVVLIAAFAAVMLASAALAYQQDELMDLRPNFVELGTAGDGSASVDGGDGGDGGDGDGSNDHVQVTEVVKGDQDIPENAIVTSEEVTTEHFAGKKITTTVKKWKQSAELDDCARDVILVRDASGSMTWTKGDQAVGVAFDTLVQRGGNVGLVAFAERAKVVRPSKSSCALCYKGPEAKYPARQMGGVGSNTDLIRAFDTVFELAELALKDPTRVSPDEPLHIMVMTDEQQTVTRSMFAFARMKAQFKQYFKTRTMPNGKPVAELTFVRFVPEMSTKFKRAIMAKWAEGGAEVDQNTRKWQSEWNRFVDTVPLMERNALADATFPEWEEKEYSRRTRKFMELFRGSAVGTHVQMKSFYRTGLDSANLQSWMDLVIKTVLPERCEPNEFEVTVVRTEVFTMTPVPIAPPVLELETASIHFDNAVHKIFQSSNNQYIIDDQTVVSGAFEGFLESVNAYLVQLAAWQTSEILALKEWADGDVENESYKKTLDDIQATYKKEYEAMIAVAKKLATAEYIIGGFASVRGDANANMRLSLSRAKAGVCMLNRILGNANEATKPYHILVGYYGETDHRARLDEAAAIYGSEQAIPQRSKDIAEEEARRITIAYDRDSARKKNFKVHACYTSDASHPCPSTCQEIDEAFCPEGSTSLESMSPTCPDAEWNNNIPADLFTTEATAIDKVLTSVKDIENRLNEKTEVDKE